MKFKLLTKFQKEYSFYKDNLPHWNDTHPMKLIDDINKFHYWKYINPILDLTDEIDENEQYIFPIWWDSPRGDLNYIPIDTMNELIAFVKKNKTYFDRRILIPVFFDVLEGFDEPAERVEYFINVFENTIPTFFVSGNHKFKNRKNLFKFYYLDHWVYHLDPNAINYKPIEKLYINLNRTLRYHRCILMDYIIDNDLLNDGYNTWSNGSVVREYLQKNTDSKINKNTYDILDFEDIGRSNPTFATPIEFCKKTFLFLVTETYYDSTNFFISEKTYKPISIGMPFMILGNPGTLEYLREKGYLTFSRWFDENYDQDAPLEDRIQIIINNLKYIKSLSNTELMKMFYEMRIICNHNLEVYKIHQRKNSFLEILDNIIQYRKI